MLGDDGEDDWDVVRELGSCGERVEVGEERVKGDGGEKVWGDVRDPGPCGDRMEACDDDSKGLMGAETDGWDEP